MMEHDEFLPGTYKCPMCDFVLSKNVISAVTGDVRVSNEAHVETCPNDGQLMVGITYKEAYHDLMSVFKEAVQRAYENGKRETVNAAPHP